MAFPQSSNLSSDSFPVGNGTLSTNSSSQTIWEEEKALPMEYQMIFGFLGLLGLFITAANVVVFVLVWKRPSLRAKTNYILISLAVSDFCSGTLAIPLLISCTSTKYSEVLCVGMDVCQRFLAISTILHLTIAVLERYFKIANPFRHTSCVTKCKVVLAVTATWVVSLLTALVQTAWIDHPNSSKMNLIYDIVVLILLVFCPFMFIAAAYTKVFLIIKKTKYARKKLSPGQQQPQYVSNPTRYNQNERRAIAVYSAMAISFAIGWFPYFILTILEDLEYWVDVPVWLSIVLLFLKYGTSLVDPLLFTLFKADFQKALMSVFFGRIEKDQRPQYLAVLVRRRRHSSHNGTSDDFRVTMVATSVYSTNSCV